MKLKPLIERIVDPIPLHPKQQEVWDAFFSGKHRRFVINAGRRFGKSTVCLAIAIELAVNYGMKVWWVGKTYQDSKKVWRNAVLILKDVYTKKSETDHRFEFFYDLDDGTELRGEITFRSADKPDNLRGEGLDLLILDEAAFQSPEVWKVLSPSLTDRRGDAIFISTPNGFNWFHSLFMRGQPENWKEYKGRWWSKHYTSYDNIYVDPKEIDAEKHEKTDTEFRIEHMAEFIDDIGKVFTNVSNCLIQEMWKIPLRPRQYAMGIDLARKHDSTICTVIDLQTNSQVFGVSYIGKDWDLQKSLLVGLIKQWSPQIVYADATAVGQPIVEDLQKLVPTTKIVPFVLSAITKPLIIQKLAVLLQNAQIRLLTTDTDFGLNQMKELMAYEVKRSKNELKWTYGAPRGMHDDTIIALALAAQAISDHAQTITIHENPFFKISTVKRFTGQLPQNSSLNKYAKASKALQQMLIDQLERGMH